MDTSHKHSAPTAEELERWRRRGNRPDNEVPVGVPADLVLARNGDLVVALIGVRVYRAGVQFDLAVRARRRLGSHLALSEVLHNHRGVADRLLLGVEFADGRVATNVRGSWPTLGDVPDDQPTLRPGGSSSGGRTADFTLWLTPLPPAGTLTVVCAWPGAGLAETRTEIDATAITRAATQAEVLWPWEPDDPGPQEPPQPPNVPPGGWFADVLRPDR